MPTTFDLVRLDQLRDWMDQIGEGAGDITGLARVAGGTQNPMFRFRRSDRSYVLRRAPEHPRPSSNAALRKEATVLRALGPTTIPVPTVVATCTDESAWNGAFVYLMELVEGFNATVELPEPHASDAGMRRAMAWDAVDTLAALGSIDYCAIGLDVLGAPEGFLERQVPRWLAELDSFRTLEGYPGPEMPGLDHTVRWLESNRPASFRAGLMHGDFHLGNLLFRSDSARVAAVVDWEMATVGDPLLDLGWLLATWPDQYDRTLAGPFAAGDGLPTRPELVARFLGHRPCDPGVIAWYGTLACFKLGILLEGTVARACAGRVPRELGDQMSRLIQVLFRRAEGFMTSGVDL